MSSMLQEKELPVVDLAENRQQELRKIISSQNFAKAPRLCAFLSYIVGKSIDGDVDSLTEQQIGIHVFNRSPGYNSNDDNIVRGTARALRQRLATYYLTEGVHDAIRIEVPKGAYVAHFLESSSPRTYPAMELLDLSDPIHDPQVSSSQSPVRRRWPLWLAWTVAVFFASIACWPLLHDRYLRSHDPSHLLWSTIFTHDKPTFIVTGDAGLNMYETIEGKTVDLASYSQQTYAPNSGPTATVGEKVGTRFYTTMSDLQLVVHLVRLPEADPNRVHIRFARDLAAGDIKDANLILLGTRSYNPWTELYQSGASLKMSWDINQDLFTVTNLAPQPGEKSLYQWTVKNGTTGGLTLITLTDNPQGGGRVLLVEGTTMLAVYAANDFLSNKQLVDPILRRAQRPDGTLRNFDVLLQSDFIREGVSNLRVLAAHIR